MHGRTAAEIIASRADATQLNMGLTSFAGERPHQSDVSVAKNYLDESELKKLAPNGVEFKTLGDIARLVRGNGMPKTDLTQDGVGAIHYGQIYTRYKVRATETISFVTPENAQKLAKVEPGDVIITNTSENVEDVGKAVAWLGEKPIVTSGHATVIKHDQDPKYLSYWFQSESFFVQKKALATGTKVIDVSAR